jgi:competence protein ComEC
LTTGFVIVSIAVYTVLSGSGPAAIRAGIMGILMATAPRLGRVYNVYTALALAAFVMSCIDPFVLWDVGFQLSFLGTLGIVLLTPYCQYPLRSLTRLPFGHIVVEIMAVSLAAQIATWPIVAITFQQMSVTAAAGLLNSILSHFLLAKARLRTLVLLSFTGASDTGYTLCTNSKI